MSPRLHIESSQTRKAFEYELKHERTYIGRALGQNNLLLEDENVSRRHAVVRRAGTSFLIEDFNSANGTFVNGERVKQRVLENNDTIVIGDNKILFDDPNGSPHIHYDNNALGKTVLLRRPDELLASLAARDAEPLAATSGVAGEALRKKADALKHLYELSQVLSAVFSLQDILKKVSEILFRATAADRFLVLLKDSATGELLPSETQFRGQGVHRQPGEIVISKTVLNHVLSERVSLLSIDAQTDVRLAQTTSLTSQRINSIMCSPLANESGVFGVIYVDCQDPLKTFSGDDLDLMNMLAVETSLAIDNATTHEQLVREALARAAFGRFMPRHVVDELLADPNAFSLGGTNKIVTTLFSDLRGFTSIAENLSPELVVQILNGYFTDLTPVIFAHDGMLDKYIGDGLMALFGVPGANKTSAADGVGAAIEMQRRMVKINQDLSAAGLPEIAMGVGINTGSATVGYIGSEQRTDYTAIGDAVNLAARLEKHAKAGQIVISQSTFQAIDDRFRTRPLGEIKVKGKNEPVKVYEVIWNDMD